MTPPHQPPRPGPEPYSSGVIPIRPATADDLARMLAEQGRKLDVLARDRTFDERRAVELQEAVGRAIMRTDAVGARLERAEQALLAELGPARASGDGALKEVRQVRGIVARHGAELAELRSAVGAPPRDPAALARESQRDLSPAEIVALETGSGLRGDVARLEVHVAQLWRRGRWAIGLGAVAAAVSPHIPAIVAALTR